MRNRKILWLMLWLFSLVLVSFQGGAAAYGFFFFCTFIPVISFLYLIAAYLQFGIYQELESRVMVAGEPMHYYFALKNEGFMTISSIRVKIFSDFSYVEKLPDDKDFELLPGESYQYETTMVAKYRGDIKVGVERLILTDFLRLFSISYKIPSALEAIVEPRVPSPEEFSLEEEFSAIKQQENRNRVDSLDMTVRDYAEGDSYRNIHWKATAASGKLKSRLTTGEQQTSVSIFFDSLRYSKLMREYLPPENKMLETVLALAQFYSLEGQPVSITYGANAQTYRIDSIADFDGFYDACRKLLFDTAGELNALEILVDAIREVPAHTKIYVLLLKYTEKEETLLAELSALGLEIQTIVISGEEAV